jgi:hypothetical protein
LSQNFTGIAAKNDVALQDWPLYVTSITTFHFEHDSIKIFNALDWLSSVHFSALPQSNVTSPWHAIKEHSALTLEDENLKTGSERTIVLFNMPKRVTYQRKKLQQKFPWLYIISHTLSRFYVH